MILSLTASIYFSDQQVAFHCFLLQCILSLSRAVALHQIYRFRGCDSHGTLTFCSDLLALVLFTNFGDTDTSYSEILN